MPVSWQIGATSLHAKSIFIAIVSSAYADCEPSLSIPLALLIASLTSGGRLQEVSVTNFKMLSLKFFMVCVLVVNVLPKIRKKKD
jgi:hypothetical protein